MMKRHIRLIFKILLSPVFVFILAVMALIEVIQDEPDWSEWRNDWSDIIELIPFLNIK